MGDGEASFFRGVVGHVVGFVAVAAGVFVVGFEEGTAERAGRVSERVSVEGGEAVGGRLYLDSREADSGSGSEEIRGKFTSKVSPSSWSSTSIGR